ncbi:MAG: hypothetical protein PQJ61_00405 [Spirochaetales bacterium]|uniref:Uncharacterized protein n=1 Tax=Candidatus Thalassospirochaeta sargassi TaxID=3119039 RepID=A0AAJ1IBU6_9SPIO|nr:hypothetical protein [Spirochaetales bacterium]
MMNTDIQNKFLKYGIALLLSLLLFMCITSSLYIADTRSLRREMLEYAHESIRFEHEQLKNLKNANIEKGYKELEQLEKLIDDYNDNSMELNELLNGIEKEIARMRERS